MRKRDWFDGILIAFIAFLSGEIVLRRWGFGQVPSQVGAGLVYALLIGNVALITLHVALQVQRSRSRRGSLSLPPQMPSGREKNG